MWSHRDIKIQIPHYLVLPLNCQRQFIPTTTASGCRGFKSRHANAQKAPHLYQIRGFLIESSPMKVERNHCI